MPAGMTTAQPRRATIDDVQELSTTLAAAFFDDPVWRWCMPDDARRREILPGFFRVIAEAHLPLGGVYTNDGAAAAVWVPPEADTDDERLLGDLEAVCAEYAPALFTLAALMAERHPRDRHHYLFFLGTRPQWQSRGLGSGLLRAVLDVCDRDGVPAYLEASSERNKALYLRHGFEVTGEIRLPGGPTMWCMWRPAQRHQLDGRLPGSQARPALGQVRHEAAVKKANRMYAIVCRYQGVTHPSEIADRVNHAVRSMAVGHCALVAYYAFDVGGGVIASVSILGDRASAEAFSDPALAWLRDDFTMFTPYPPEVTAGEVVAAVPAAP